MMSDTVRTARARTDEGIEPGHPTWGVCPGCQKDRRLTRFREMIDHNRWDPTYQRMTLCLGSGSHPVRITGYRRNRKGERV